MNSSSHSIEGFFPYKMDAKCRVSVPSDWRNEIGNGVLRLLQSSNENLPTLRVLTESEFEKMQEEINERDWTPAQKRAMLGALFERSMRAHINEQGKLSIPKSLCDHPGITAGETIILAGRGNYIEILNEENYEKLRVAREATIAELDAELGFF